MANISLLQGLGQALGEVAPGYMAGQEKARLWNRQDVEDAWSATSREHQQREWDDSLALRQAQAKAYEAVGPIRPGESPYDYKVRLNDELAKAVPTNRGDMKAQFALAGANAFAERDAYAKQSWQTAAQKAIATGDKQAILSVLQSDPSHAFANVVDFNRATLRDDVGAYNGYVLTFKDGSKKEIPEDVAATMVIDPAKGMEQLHKWRADRNQEGRWSKSMEFQKLSLDRNPQKEILEAAANASGRLAASRWQEENPYTGSTSEDLEKYNDKLRKVHQVGYDQYLSGAVGAKNNMDRGPLAVLRSATDELKATMASQPFSKPEQVAASLKRVNEARKAMGLTPISATPFKAGIAGGWQLKDDKTGKVVDIDRVPGAPPAGGPGLPPNVVPYSFGSQAGQQVPNVNELVPMPPPKQQ